MAPVQPDISVVIPVFNEAPNLKPLYERLVTVMEALGRSFEIVAVDDGSSDGSLALLNEIRAGDRRLRIVRLSRNFGQTPALYAGFANTRGAIVVSIDADLQNPPEEIPKVIAKLDEGYDVVQGWREIRQDSAFRKTASKMLNGFVSRATGVKIRDLGCGLKAYRREILDHMTQFTHHTRYVPAEFVWLGAHIGEVKVEHRERAGGDSKYSIFSLLRLNFDMIASVTSAPLKIMGLVGWLLSIVGFGMGFRILLMRLIYGNYDPLATITALFFLLVGVHMIATGIMCEYISRIFIETQNKPYYVVREVLEEKESL